MSILESQFFKPALLGALAIPLLAYDFSTVNWLVALRPIDLSQPAMVTDTFHVPRNGPYLMELGIAGKADDCIWGVTGAICENTHRELDANWTVSDGERVVLEGHSSAGFPGTWTTEEGSSGVALGSFDAVTGKRYDLSIVVNSAAPDLAKLKPRVTVEAGQKLRDADLVKHAVAFVIAMLVLVGSIVVAQRSARKRAAEAR
ncbi:MAG: hypothetical protein ABI442_19625 [Gemmatimonadaceae bacterium]